MKTQIADIVLCTMAIILNTLVSVIIVLGVSQWVTIPLTQDYHVIFDFFVFIYMWCLCSSLLCQAIIGMKVLVAGTYEMKGKVFICWKFFNVFYEAGRGILNAISFVFMRCMIEQMFGAKIGQDVALAGRLFDPQLITIGNGVILGYDSILSAHNITSGHLVLQPIVIKDQVTIGANAVVLPGVTIGEGSIVATGAVVAPNTIIPPHELWGGVPAKKIKDLNP